jgi:hypothetical protein
VQGEKDLAALISNVGPANYDSNSCEIQGEIASISQREDKLSSLSSVATIT